MTTKSYIVLKDKAQTLTNKTINADSNVIQNLEAGNFKAQATSEAGKCFGVKSDGSIGLISSSTAVDNTTIEVNSDDKLAVKDAGVTLAKLAPQATTEAGKVVGVQSDGTIGLLAGTGGDYLPLAGGTMTGSIQNGITNGAPLIIGSTSDKSIDLQAGSSDEYGAELVLRGIDSASDKGGFVLYAKNGSDIKALRGWTYGGLTWDNNDILTSVGGKLNGTLETDTVSLVAIKGKNDNTGSVAIEGGQNAALIELYGTKATSCAGNFVITSMKIDGTTFSPVQLVGNGTTGKLTWNGNEVLTATNDYLLKSGGTMTGGIVCDTSVGGYNVITNSTDTSSVDIIASPSTNLNSAELILHGAEQLVIGDDRQGMFELTARKNTTESKILLGNPNGSLTWAGNEVETQNNKVTSISSTSTDVQYPSAKAVYNYSADKVSKTNADNFTISAGGSTLGGYSSGELYWRGNEILSTNDIIDGLTSTSTSDALSANQGKVLDESKENVSNKVTSISSSSTDTQYPSAKAVYDAIPSTSGFEQTANKVTSISSSSTDTQYPTAKAVYSNTSNKLPLAGGTMTGPIKSTASDPTVAANTNTSYITLCGGSTYSNGAYMQLNGASKSTSAGEFSITARNASYSSMLNGTPSGSLTWKGNAVHYGGVSSGTDCNAIDFGNGYGIITGSSEVSGVSATTAWGGMYYANEVSMTLCTSPKSISSVLNIMVGSKGANGFISRLINDPTIGTDKKTVSALMFFARGTSATSLTIRCDFMMLVKWA